MKKNYIVYTISALVISLIILASLAYNSSDKSNILLNEEYQTRVASLDFNDKQLSLLEDIVNDQLITELNIGLPYDPELRHILVLCVISLITGLFGSAVSYSLQIDHKPEEIDPEKKVEPKSFRSYLAPGLGAAYLVPLFLHMIGSDIIKFKVNEVLPLNNYLYFLGFCLLAAITSRRFILSLADKAFEKAEHAEKEVKSLRGMVSSSKIEVNSLKETVSSSNTDVNNLKEAVGHSEEVIQKQKSTIEALESKLGNVQNTHEIESIASDLSTDARQKLTLFDGQRKALEDDEKSIGEILPLLKTSLSLVESSISTFATARAYGIKANILRVFHDCGVEGENYLEGSLQAIEDGLSVTDYKRNKRFPALFYYNKSCYQALLKHTLTDIITSIKKSIEYEEDSIHKRIRRDRALREDDYKLHPDCKSILEEINSIEI